MPQPIGRRASRTFGWSAADPASLDCDHGEKRRPRAVGRTPPLAAARPGMAGLGAPRRSRAVVGPGGLLREDVAWPPVTLTVGVVLALTLLWRRTHPLAAVAVAFGFADCGRCRDDLRGRRTDDSLPAVCRGAPPVCSYFPIRCSVGGPGVRPRSDWSSSWPGCPSRSPPNRPRMPPS